MITKIHQAVDELTYINYKFNRIEYPEVSPQRWANVYGKNSESMEERFQKENNT